MTSLLKRSLTWSSLRRLLPFVALAVMISVPYSSLNIPVLFERQLNHPVTLRLLANCLIVGGLALSYDLLFGRTGMLSFGHALYYGAGGYGAVLLLNHTGWPLLVVVLATIVGVAVLALVVGSVALRTKAIAFAMVTLAVAQLGATLVGRNPGGYTGGEEGLRRASGRLPDWMLTVANTVNLYWIALAFLAVVAFVVHRIDNSPAGRVLAAVRDDDRRVDVLGLSPYRFRLLAFVIAGTLGGLAGVVHILLYPGAGVEMLSSSTTLGLLVMVVLGGPGTRWGPVIGGIIYAYLSARLVDLSDSSAVAGLPGWLAAPLGEPLLILGVIFILAVYFFPGGLAGLAQRLGPIRRLLPARGSAPGRAS